MPISPAMAARVAGRASKQKQTLTEAVDALLALAFRGIDAASIAGKKRWAGTTAAERSDFGRKAVESRWAKFDSEYARLFAASAACRQFDLICNQSLTHTAAAILNNKVQGVIGVGRAQNPTRKCPGSGANLMAG